MSWCDQPNARPAASSVERPPSSNPPSTPASPPPIPPPRPESAVPPRLPRPSRPPPISCQLLVDAASFPPPPAQRPAVSLRSLRSLRQNPPPSAASPFVQIGVHLCPSLFHSSSPPPKVLPQGECPRCALWFHFRSRAVERLRRPVTPSRPPACREPADRPPSSPAEPPARGLRTARARTNLPPFP